MNFPIFVDFMKYGISDLEAKTVGIFVIYVKFGVST